MPQPGQRIRLAYIADPFTRLRPGDTGVITAVEDAGTVFVRCDDGHELGLIDAEDRWKVIES